MNTIIKQLASVNANGVTAEQVIGVIKGLDESTLEAVTSLYATERQQIEKILTFSPSQIKSALDKIDAILAEAKKAFEPTVFVASGTYTKAELAAILADMD